MNGKTIRQSFAILTLGLAVMATGCRNHEKEAQNLAAYKKTRSAYESRLAPYTATPRSNSQGTSILVDVYTIDRALTLSEIRNQYNQATADEFARQGLHR